MRDRPLAAGLFGLAALVGLVGAYVGLSVSSFWLDELFTVWVIHPQHLSTMFGRALSDVHPPLYYSSLYLFSRVAGQSETPLRLFSALCATGAVAVFVLGTRAALSLPSRLFAAAMATASEFWFYQAQNARSYGLALFLGAALVVVALRLYRSPAAPKGSHLALLAAVSFAGAFVHWYGALLALSVTVVLALWSPSGRARLIALAAALFLAVLLYVKLAVGAHAVFSTTSSWIGGSLGWYVSETRMAASQTLTPVSAAALAICLGSMLFAAPAAMRRLRGARSRQELAHTPFGTLLFCLAVGTIFVGAAVASSILMSPNFIARNLLLYSPFLWTAVAALYDSGVAEAAPLWRGAANLALGVSALVMSLIVLNRALPHNDPFRESALWIAAQPACRGQALPVITDDSAPEEQAASRYFAKEGFGYYLGRPDLIVPFFEQEVAGAVVPPALRALAANRVRGGCPVLAWGVHGFSGEDARRLADRLAPIVREQAPARRVEIRSFDAYDYGLFDRAAHPAAFVIVVD